MPIDAKHQSAPAGKKVQMSAKTFRLAPIRTCPAPVRDCRDVLRELDEVAT